MMALILRTSSRHSRSVDLSRWTATGRASGRAPHLSYRQTTPRFTGPENSNDWLATWRRSFVPLPVSSSGSNGYRNGLAELEQGTGEDRLKDIVTQIAFAGVPPSFESGVRVGRSTRASQDDE